MSLTQRLTRLPWFWLGPALGMGAYFWGDTLGLAPAAALTLGLTTWCAVWWVTEPVPIAVTSLLPFFGFPLAGVLTEQHVGEAYGHPVILLLLGGFLLSLGLESSGAHKRLALHLVRLFGGRSGSPLLLGFMLTAALLSMWISNSATTLMLLPLASAVIEDSDDPRFAPRLLLGVAYGASIGGLGTPIGTPPNAIFIAIHQEFTGLSISFLDWMQIGVPAVLLLLPMAWWQLSRGLAPGKLQQFAPREPMTHAEKRVLAIFAATALLWVTRTEPFGGWSEWGGFEHAGDATVALLGASLLFWVPNGKGQKLLEWRATTRLPWGLLLLFAGGIAIAKAFTESGLAQSFAAGLAGLQSWPTLALVLTICLVVTFLTEVTSNTATATLLMPVLATAALAAGVDPKLLMIPATLSASCAFMLPVATAPNAIVFGTGQLTVRQMAQHGFVLNVVGALLLTGLCWLTLG